MPGPLRILAVDDDRLVRAFLAETLEGAGYRVALASNGPDALALRRSFRPDLILLDVMMPAMDGLRVCREIRREDAETPVVFLTALDSEADEVRALDAGADAHIPKTVSPALLLARVAARLRRRPESVAAFEFGGWRVEPEKLLMRHASGAEASLTEREVALLRLFATRPGEVFLRDFLLTRFWERVPSCDDALSMAIARLRAKLRAEGRYLVSVRGSGYAYRFPAS